MHLDSLVSNLNSLDLKKELGGISLEEACERGVRMNMCRDP